MSVDRLIDEITEELKVKYGKEPTFNEESIRCDVKDAYRDVRSQRCYKYSSWNEEKILQDLYDNYYYHIKKAALFDFAQSGAPFEISHSENSTSRTWRTRDEVLGNIPAFVGIF